MELAPPYFVTKPRIPVLNIQSKPGSAFPIKQFLFLNLSLLSDVFSNVILMISLTIIFVPTKFGLSKPSSKLLISFSVKIIFGNLEKLLNLRFLALLTIISLIKSQDEFFGFSSSKVYIVFKSIFEDLLY